MDEEPDIRALLESLKNVFNKENKSQEFDEEKEIYEILLPKLVIELSPAYKVVDAIAIGSTASVWKVQDITLDRPRALKLTRPRLGKEEDVVIIVRTEAKTMSALSHNNILEIFTAGEIVLEQRQYKFPYILMDFMPGIQDFDEYIVGNLAELTADQIIGFFRDALAGVDYLHNAQIYHCDLKPGNILISDNGRAMVADLGFAKHFPKPGDDDMTEVTLTPKWAHPRLLEYLTNASDPAQSKSEIPRNKLVPAFDLFPLGRTFQHVLNKIRVKEIKESIQIFSQYQWVYLQIIAARLLDGQPFTQEPDYKICVTIPQMPLSCMRDLCYPDAQTALEDCEKLLNFYDLEGAIPELSPNYPNYIQIPNCKVPLTPRVQKLITHPYFARLSQVTQLGFVSMLYPGATHSRFEHVLGTFSRACEYIRSLWYDEANCLFSSIMDKHWMEIGMVASLVHDISQFPMSHDLSEHSDKFEHEAYIRQLLVRCHTETESSLADVIEIEWGIKVDDIMNVFFPKSGLDIRFHVLKAIVSGPIDCDKLDYLQRDSAHLGVIFGSNIDIERLLRNITLVFTSQSTPTLTGSTLKYVGIGVTEKALIPAKSMYQSRTNMFTQVYWHHTIRALKAMLGYIVRNTLIELEGDESKRDEFWSCFENEFIFSCVFDAPKEADEATTLTDNVWEGEYPDTDGEAYLHNKYRLLASSDNAMLSFIARFNDSDAAKTILRAIRTRHLYERIAVLSAPGQKFTEIYEKYKVYRHAGKYMELEQIREKLEKEILDKLADRIDADKLTEMKQVVPLLLVDVPIKGSASNWEDEILYYLSEDTFGQHAETTAFFPQFKTRDVLHSQSAFDESVGKIRVYCYPKYRGLMVEMLRGEDLIGLII
jgi:HD superfamily phosphohydrolase